MCLHVRAPGPFLPMIGFIPDPWRKLREQYANRGWSDTSWGQYASLDGDGFVRMRTLLSGDVVSWASQIMADDMERDREYAQDYTQRMREER